MLGLGTWDPGEPALKKVGELQVLWLVLHFLFILEVGGGILKYILNYF